MLDWSAMPGDGFLLEQSRHQDFATSQKQALNRIQQSTLSGFDNGTYYFRVQNSHGDWSNTVTVVVEHHSLSRAWRFFYLGLFLFGVLIATLVTGHLRGAKE